MFIVLRFKRWHARSRHSYLSNEDIGRSESDCEHRHASWRITLLGRVETCIAGFLFLRSNCLQIGRACIWTSDDSSAISVSEYLSEWDSSLAAKSTTAWSPPWEVASAFHLENLQKMKCKRCGRNQAVLTVKFLRQDIFCFVKRWFVIQEISWCRS